MKRSHRRYKFLILSLILSFTAINCGSSGGSSDDSNHSEKIDKHWLTVSIPIEGKVNLSPDVKIDFIFSESIAPETLTINSSDNTCSGNIQLSLSSNNFSKCIPFKGQIDSTNDNCEFSLTPTNQLEPGNYKIKLNQNIKNSFQNRYRRKLRQEYITPKGFSIKIKSWEMISGDLTSDGLNIDNSAEALNLDLASYNNKLYAAWNEASSDTSDYLIRVKSYDGANWNSAGEIGEKGISKSKATRSDTLDLVVYKDKLYLTWSEPFNSISQIRLKEYDGTNWNWADGGLNTGMNLDSSQDAKQPILAVHDEKLYLAWQEKKSGIYKIRVKEYDGVNWRFIDNDIDHGLNKNFSKNAYTPTLISYKDRLYAAWEENKNPKPNIMVKEYSGNSWAFIDNGNAGINYASGQRAYNPALIADNDYLYVTWNEELGAKTQIRAKTYNGASWSFIDSGEDTGINIDSNMVAKLPTAIIFANELYVSWQEASGDAEIIRVKKYKDSTWDIAENSQNAGLNHLNELKGNSVKFEIFNDGLYAGWNEVSGDGLNGFSLIKISRAK